MICPNCGFENIDTAKFCNECGSPLRAEKQETEAAAKEDAAAGAEREPGTPAEAETDTAAEAEPPTEAGTENGGDTGDDAEDASEPEAAAGTGAASAAVAEAPASPFDSDEAPLVHASEESDDDYDTSDMTAPLDLPPVFPDAPDEEPGGSRSEQLHSSDPSGVDEVLVDASYESRSSAWPKGDTMEMPRIEGEEPPEQKDYKAPDPNKGASRGKKAAIVSVAVVAALALGALGITYALEIWGGKVIPDVTGQDRSQATQAIEAKGFTVTSKKVKSDDSEGIVLLTDPGAGKRLPEGSEVILQVATPRAIPSVVGKTEEEARKAFEQEGFTKVDFVKVKSNDPEGVVASVEPGPDSKAKASTPITVKVTEAYVVPDIMGKGQSEASKLLQDEGYQASFASVYTDAVAEGTVVSSDPEAGTKLPSGSPVTVGIAKSRANELVNLTSGIVGAYETDANGDTYRIASLDSTPTYLGGNTTQVAATVEMSHTFANGSVVSTSTQRTLTVVWDDSNAPSISGMY